MLDLRGAAGIVAIVLPIAPVVTSVVLPILPRIPAFDLCFAAAILPCPAIGLGCGRCCRRYGARSNGLRRSLWRCLLLLAAFVATAAIAPASSAIVAAFGIVLII
jgi:hypothetical protein